MVVIFLIQKQLKAAASCFSEPLALSPFLAASSLWCHTKTARLCCPGSAELTSARALAFLAVSKGLWCSHLLSFSKKYFW